ncbi:zinc finger domain-containing protein [Streptomyces laurentii]
MIARRCPICKRLFEDCTCSSPARALPALTVACPTCGSRPGALCTSHSGTRPRLHDVHQTRTTAWRTT